MTGFMMVIHALISILLLVVILMQSGRGGGLTEGFASAESMFGAQTNAFMIKATTVFASLFLVTCLGLAVMSSQKGKSLMSNTIAPETQQILDSQTEIDEVIEDITQNAEKIDLNIGAEGESEVKVSEPAPQVDIPLGSNSAE